MFDIFERINRTGTMLNQQEMRNALYQGKATLLLKKLAESRGIRTGNGKSTKKQYKNEGKISFKPFSGFLFIF